MAGCQGPDVVDVGHGRRQARPQTDTDHNRNHLALLRSLRLTLPLMYWRRRTFVAQSSGRAGAEGDLQQLLKRRFAKARQYQRPAAGRQAPENICGLRTGFKGGCG